MSFRIGTILYVFAVVVAAVTALGVFGLLCAALVLAFWGGMYLSADDSSPRRRVLRFVLTLIVLLIALTILVPIGCTAREASRRTQCVNQMRQLGLALLDYHDIRGRLPHAHDTDSEGNPLLSWRVQVLPYIEQIDLYKRFRFDEAWNGPNNTSPSSTVLEMLHCPSEDWQDPPAPTASYFAVVGPQTAWPEERDRTWSDFTDGRARTILLIEAQDKGMNWAEPRDLSFDEAVDLLSQPVDPEEGHPIERGYFHKPSVGRNILYADGHVVCLQRPLEREVAVALLTVAGGEEVNANEVFGAGEPPVDYVRWYAFLLMMTLSVLPIFFLGHIWKDPSEAPATEESAS